MKYAWLCGVLILAAAGTSVADTQREEFNAGLKVTDAVLAAGIAELLQDYADAHNRRGTGLETSQDFDKITFYFAAGKGYLKGERVAMAALDLFDDDAIAEITRLPTNSDVCYVQGLTLAPSGQRVTLAVFDLPDKINEDIYRCLVAGLWRQKNGTLNGSDVSDWKHANRALLERP